MSLFAAAQIQANDRPADNLKKISTYVQRASARGAKMVILPENAMAWIPENDEEGGRIRRVREAAQPLDGPFMQELQALAKNHAIWIVGCMLEQATAPETRPYNTAVVINDRGERVSIYRKSHLFDAFGYAESAAVNPGPSIFTPIETPFGKMGLFVCYDLRFPEILRTQVLQGVDFFVMCSGWVGGNLKEYQWRHLLVARAIENTTPIFACNHASNMYIGHSLFIDPMGIILAEGNEGEDLIFGEFSRERLQAVRQRVPSLRHRRPDLYHL